MAVTVKLGEKKVWKVNVGVASNGTRDHTKLENRDKADQHPINSISGLEKALSQKAAAQDLKGHVDNKQNPHGLTAEQVGARPNTWLPTPEQIGAAPALDWSHLKWYVMGDSLTAQDNAFTNKRYYDFVQEKTGIQVIVDGIGGTGYGAGASNSESYYDRVQNIPDDVDIVTIFGSGNDIRFAEGANMDIYNTLSWLALNKPGLRVIVVPPAPWLGYNKREDPWKAYCDRLQACASVCNFRYVSDMYDCPPFNPNFTGHMEVFFTTDPEGIHPDENGHKALAPYFYNALLQELALDSDVETPGGGGSGQNPNGGGLSTTAANLLIEILRNGVYSTDQSANITALEAALASGGNEEEPDIPDIPDVPDEPDTPVEPTEPVYSSASPLTTDGESMVDTGYALADKDKNWTIVCDLTGKPGYQVPAWGLRHHIAMWSKSAWFWYCGYNIGNFTYCPDELNLVTGNLTNFKTVLIHNKGEETITTYYVANSALATLTASNLNYSSFVGTTATVTLGGATDNGGDKFWAANNTINDFKIYERVLTEDEIKAYLGLTSSGGEEPDTPDTPDEPDEPATPDSEELMCEANIVATGRNIDKNAQYSFYQFNASEGSNVYEIPVEAGVTYALALTTTSAYPSNAYWDSAVLLNALDAVKGCAVSATKIVDFETVGSRVTATFDGNGTMGGEATRTANGDGTYTYTRTFVPAISGYWYTSNARPSYGYSVKKVVA